MKPSPVLEELTLPSRIDGIAELEELLSTPTRGLVEDFRRLEGDLMILGVGGKVGPTLAIMAKRAAPGKRVIGVARFSDPEVRQTLEQAGVETLTCDLLDREAVAKLPNVPNIIYMAGKKFGTAGQEPYTWAMNAVVPTIVGERFRNTRIVAFSTLCVYPFAEVSGPGSTEDDSPTPVGEYANSCVARERVFQYYSERNQNPGRLARLNYAIDLRYGVLRDIALWVQNEDPIDVRTGVANVIWQGEASAHILRALLHGTIPARPLNIGMRQPAKVRHVAEAFGRLLGKKPRFTGTEQSHAWHNSTEEAYRLFGPTRIDLDTMIQWNADWILRDQPAYEKPTHYEERAGSF